MSQKSLDELTEDDFYNIACSQGWKDLWEHDRGQVEIDRSELIERGEDIIQWMVIGEPSDTQWVRKDNLNEWLEENNFIKFS